ncbi:MAG: UDP-glucose/GDP-mannose dehydrogenase family protein [Micrococcus sp.]|nr:UDP-glucose/GDP-mannose dehydrogenase family protein [Micrococcus sp.]
MRMSVIGTGYLGATHAACMAELGFEVIGVDVDPAKIERLSRGEVPFHEPGLPELIRRHVATGRLRFTTDYAEIGDWADVHFIGVGTPQQPGSAAADLRYVDAAVTSLAQVITRDALIVGKSTVPVGTARRLAGLLAELRVESGLEGEVELAWNPEFLREGFAVQDTLRPDRLVVGVDSEQADATLRAVYAEALGRDTPYICTDFETAELVKVAANAFLATKISFINAFSEVTETVGGDIATLADAIGLDPRIGRRFLNAGVGFGGGCLPKDIRALRARAAELGLASTFQFLNEMDRINLRRRDRVVDLAAQQLAAQAVSGTERDGGERAAAMTTRTALLMGKRIAILGVAFKPDSDDVRDSPALDVAARLHASGADTVVYDPQANANAAGRFPRLEYVEDVETALRDADLAILLTEWQEFRDLDPARVRELMRTASMIDARNVLDREAWNAAGVETVGLGQHLPATVTTVGD